MRGIHRGPVNSPHKWPVARKMFPLDDVIMLMFSFILRLNMILNKHSSCWWLEMPWRWRDVIEMVYLCEKTCISTPPAHWFCDADPDSKVHGPWGPSEADRTQVGPMLAPWTLLSGDILVDEIATLTPIRLHCNALNIPCCISSMRMTSKNPVIFIIDECDFVKLTIFN